VLLSAPRRSAGIPNAKGSAALFTVSTYSFADKKTSSELRLLNFGTNESELIASEGAEAKWLDDNTIVALLSGENGTTNVVIGDVSGDFNKT
jgi:hypothetical protein